MASDVVPAGTSDNVWRVEPGERRSVGVIHIVILALLIGIGFVVGAFGSISFPLGFGVNFFWTGIAVQQVGSIWNALLRLCCIHSCESSASITASLGFPPL
jgi:hypothetical protein